MVDELFKVNEEHCVHYFMVCFPKQVKHIKDVLDFIKFKNIVPNFRVQITSSLKNNKREEYNNCTISFFIC